MSYGYRSQCKTCAYNQKAKYRLTDKCKQSRNKLSKKISYRFIAGKYSAKKRGYKWLLTIEDYEMLISNPCHYCGGKLNETGSGLDRKNNEQFYDIHNSVSCCGRCNMTFMHNFNYEEKLQLGETIAKIDLARIRNLQLLNNSTNQS